MDNYLQKEKEREEERVLKGKRKIWQMKNERKEDSEGYWYVLLSHL